MSTTICPSVVCAMRRTSTTLFRLQDEIQMWKHVAKKLPPALQLVVSHLEEAEECKFKEFDSYRIIEYATPSVCRSQEQYREQYAAIQAFQQAIKKLKVVAKELPNYLLLVLSGLEEFEEQAIEEYNSNCSTCTCCL